MQNADAPKQEAARPATGRSSRLDALVGSSKAALSAILAVFCCRNLGLPEEGWAAISAVVVTQPGLHPSARASWFRVMANLIGAFVGAGLSVLAGRSLGSLGLGIFLTGLICHLARLDDALRPAFAAVVIVMFIPGGNAWHESMNRVFAVVLGCAASLAVGWAYDKSTGGYKLWRGGEDPARDAVE